MQIVRGSRTPLTIKNTMELSEIVGYIISAGAGGGITQIFNWRYSRKKAKEDVKSDQIDNMSKSLDFYKNVISDQNDRIRELKNENDELRATVNNQQRQIMKLQEQIAGIYRLLGKDSQEKLRDEKGRFRTTPKSR